MLGDTTLQSSDAFRMNTAKVVASFKNFLTLNFPNISAGFLLPNVGEYFANNFCSPFAKLPFCSTTRINPFKWCPAREMKILWTLPLEKYCIHYYHNECLLRWCSTTTRFNETIHPIIWTRWINDALINLRALLVHNLDSSTNSALFIYSK